jgi:hypothetical protein
MRRKRVLRVPRLLVNALRATWLSAISRNPRLFETVLGAAVLAVVYGGLYLFAETERSARREVWMGIVAVVIAGLVVRQARTWGMGRLTTRIATLARYRARVGGEFFERLAEYRIGETVSLAESLENDGFYASTTEDIAQLCEVMFSNGGFRYIGTDRHVPSGFVDLYGWYLALHQRSLASRPTQQSPIRGSSPSPPALLPRTI